MKQGTKDHVAGKLHKARSTVKEAAGQVNKHPALSARVKSRRTPTKARRAAETLSVPAATRRIGTAAAEALNVPEASRWIKAAASEASKLPATMMDGITGLPRLIADWGKALFSAFLKVTQSLISYAGDMMMWVMPPYKRGSSQAA